MTAHSSVAATFKKRVIAISVATLTLGGISLFMSLQQAPITTKVGDAQQTTDLEGLITKTVVANNSPTAVRTVQAIQVAPTPTNSPKIMAQTPRSFAGKAFAPSIEGTDIDGRLKADVNGNLILDLEVRDMFDYFMNTVADVAPEVALGELEKLARAHLPEKAANQAMALLDDYLAYKEAALIYSRKPLLPADQQTPDYQVSMLTQSFNQLKELRRSAMSREAVDAFFGMEEAYGEYTLANIRIQMDTSLSPESKQLKLAQARTQLPTIVRETEERIHAEQQLSQEVNTLLQSDMSNTDLQHTLAEKGLQSDAIDDALAYRASQQSFDQQYQLYKAERDQLLQSGLSEKDMKPELERLRQQHFDDEQGLTQARVRDLRS